MLDEERVALTCENIKALLSIDEQLRLELSRGTCPPDLPVELDIMGHPTFTAMYVPLVGGEQARIGFGSIDWEIRVDNEGPGLTDYDTGTDAITAWFIDNAKDILRVIELVECVE